MKGLECNELGLTAVPLDCDLGLLPCCCQCSILVHAHRQGLVTLPQMLKVRREVENNRRTENGALCCLKYVTELLASKTIQLVECRKRVFLQLHPDKQRDEGVFKDFFKRQEDLLKVKDVFLREDKKRQDEIVRVACEATRAECKAVTSLQRAHWRDSDVGGLHPQGLAACSNLRHVSMDNIEVIAIDPSETLDLATLAPSIPKSMSRLTNLYFLLGIDMVEKAELQVSQLYQLTALAYFSHMGSSALHLEVGLSQLTDLVCLSLGSSPYLTNQLVYISFPAIDWQKLYSLEYLKLYECKLSFGVSILTVVEHQRVHTIVFDKCVSADQNTSKYYADLVESLALRRPDIRFSAVLTDI